MSSQQVPQLNSILEAQRENENAKIYGLPNNLVDLSKSEVICRQTATTRICHLQTLLRTASPKRRSQESRSEAPRKGLGTESSDAAGS